MEAIQTLREVLNGRRLSGPAARAFFDHVAAGAYDDIQLAALLATLHARGETADEISGAAAALLEVARPFPKPDYLTVDAAGTGGDHSGTINISTGASLVAAAAGAKVIKHGNRAVSSLAGSADVIRSLRIPMPEDAATARELLDRHGFAFLMAPNFHPVLALFMPVRRSLGIPTMMNLMGPLLNPARPDVQLLGVGNPAQAPLMANALHQLGRRHALVVHGFGLDEISVTDATDVYEVTPEGVEHRVITPRDLGLTAHDLTGLKGGDADFNAAALERVFAGAGPAAARAAIAVNAGALLYLVGLASDLRAGVALAGETIDSGRVVGFLAGLRGE